MTRKPGRTFVIAVLILFMTSFPLLSQTPDEWRQDIDTLTGLIAKHHPHPWARVSQKDFLERTNAIKAELPDWSSERVIVELMSLVASLYDGHTEIRLTGQERFNLWFPVRIEKFRDGLFITACAEAHGGLLGSRILNLGNLEALEAYRKVATIVSKDSEAGASRLTANYLSNAIVLKALDIINDEKVLPLELVTAGNEKKSAALSSDAWAMRNNWTWNKAAVPTKNKTVTVFDNRLSELPPYLSKLVPARIPYWFEFYPEKKMLFLQFNAVVNWNKDPFPDFTKKLFKSYDDNVRDIDKFVIDLRFNEGGNGALLPPFLQEFILRRDSLPRGKLYIITGSRTFSAASNLIGKMLKYTSAITVGDIAPGPLNWYSDAIELKLPNSNLLINISSMFWMEGHALDQRGCYPPDHYLPETYRDFVAFKDMPLEAILAGTALPLKDVLRDQGWDKFKAEFDARKAQHADVEHWFPHTHFDLVMTAYFDLLSSGKGNDALELLKFNAGLYPDDFRSWYGLAEVAKELDKTDLALSSYEALMKMEPQIADVRPSYHAALLLKSFRDGGVKGLAATYEKMKTAHPQEFNENSLNVMGYGLLQKGKAQDALSVFMLNLELFPDYANGYDSLGEAWLKIGDKQKARQAYEKALKLDPGLSSAKNALEELNKKSRG